MAASSCESSLAPVDFLLPTSFESSDSLTVAVERCPLCTTSRRPFYCSGCVNKGSFVHSSSNLHESFHARQDKWKIKKKECSELQERIKLKVAKKHQRDLKISEIEECKRKIELLKSSIELLKRKTEDDQKVLERRKVKNGKGEKDFLRHQDKMTRLRRYVEAAQSAMEKKHASLTTDVRSLKSYRRFHVDILVQCIFSVKEIQPRSETENLAMSTVSALKEACQTTFVRGHWVYTDNGGDTGHRIVEPSLPGNGDYSAYNVWVSENKENGAAPEKEAGHRNPGHTISAALCYTTQLVSVIAHILDVCLPRRLCYSEFCLSDLSERQLTSAVSRLNHNVLHLCFSQNVNPAVLIPKHTLHNVVMLLKCPDFGRICAFEVNESMIQSISDSNTSEESDEEHFVSEDEIDIGIDWERVPHDLEVPTRAGLGTTSTVYTMAYSSQMNTNTTHSTAGSLMSSAAASVASIWRAATSQFERR
ncbi:beclin 1-associated autophagy-related key regulator-like [Haliotis asinina]|uniref:beclin 1-associated autophagy-related key regulator-like n=1 Tax=Haliotis asinina TaxID=109174 RepID=UPI00353240AA